MKNNPLLLIDGYKSSHHMMYPDKTTLVYSNFTPRSINRMPNEAKEIVVFGMQYAIKYIHNIFNDNFFNISKDVVINEAKTVLSKYLSCDYDVSHFEKLHDLGYLPIKIKCLEEGLIINEKIPILTIQNTLPDFFWLTNFLETLFSSLIWKPLHSASIAFAFKKILYKYAKLTDKNNIDFIDFQGHDFSFRGMQHCEAAISSGLGWLTSFKGSDTVPAVSAAEYYYGGDNIGFSVPATEHSVMTAYGKENEIAAFEHLLNKFPTGILSIVSDSFDLWSVIDNILPLIKEKILLRDGKLVIRPDSGDPVNIICGTNENKGVVEKLWDIFGGSINDQGYKMLDKHIGCIYGDSITLERAEAICEKLQKNGFASTNCVFGVGSYSLGYATRDSQGCAIKATYCVIDGKCVDIFKEPITDDGEKKSAKGLLMVYFDDKGNVNLKDKCSIEEEQSGLLRTVYIDGLLSNNNDYNSIRSNIDCALKMS